jgi:hypothetical protein
MSTQNSEEQDEVVVAEWVINAFPFDVVHSKNASIEQRALTYAKHVQKEYFKESVWVLTVTINGRRFSVDTLSNLATELK